jgi:hypothetical protein
MKKKFYYNIMCLFLLFLSINYFRPYFSNAADNQSQLKTNSNEEGLRNIDQELKMRTFNLNTVTYPEMLALYKEILESNKWIFAIFLTVLTITGGGSFFLYNKSVKEISELAFKFNKLKVDLENKIIDYNKLSLLHSDLEAKIKSLTSDSQRIDNSLGNLAKRIKIIQGELDTQVRKIAIFSNIETYTIQVCNEKSEESYRAMKALIEFSKDLDPSVRLKSINSFRFFAKYSTHSYSHKQIIKMFLNRLNYLVEKEPEFAIKQEAIEIKNLFMLANN